MWPCWNMQMVPSLLSSYIIGSGFIQDRRFFNNYFSLPQD